MTQRALKGASGWSGPRPAATLVDRVNAAIVSSLGLGYAPVASGTFGTLGGLGLVLLIQRVICPRFGWHFGLTVGIVAAVVLFVGIALGGWAERYYRLKDPGPFVLDEVLGYLVSVLRIKEGGPGWQELVLAFVAFRIFDVLKPPPARRLEHLPRGFGIMLDDLVAAIYALVLVCVVRMNMPLWP